MRSRRPIAGVRALAVFALAMSWIFALMLVAVWLIGAPAALLAAHEEGRGVATVAAQFAGLITLAGAWGVYAPRIARRYRA